MSTKSRPRFGSLQFYPRKRISRSFPSVNWKPVSNSSVLKDEGLLGFIAYKAGMTTAIVKDDTEKSLTKGKKISLPVTILEVPPMKILSVRFYKNSKVMTEIIVSNDKELKRKLKMPKAIKKSDDLGKIENFDDVRVLAYSLVKQTNIKKTPDIVELAVNSEDKINFVKNLVNKEIHLSDVLKWGWVDVRGITKGKGLQGPVKRFGITLKQHKSEKGVRRPGSIGPWHPARVTFRVPMAGQLGVFSRVHYNFNVIGNKELKEDNSNKVGEIKHYGFIKKDYVILAGSVQGPKKRQVLITPAMRAAKRKAKRNFELIELRGSKGR